MINLISKIKNELTIKEIKEICLLKNQEWKFGYKSQISWFKKNIFPKDICNLLKFNNKIISLTILRKRTLFLKKKKIKYFLFDTLIIKKNFRRKKLSELLMYYNNHKILKNNKISILFCNNALINFYKKFGWLKYNKKNVIVNDYDFKSNILIYNSNKFFKHGNNLLSIFINK